jgi:pyrroline-5-carboxylate reductase
MSDLSVGFIGAGRMGTALGKGFLNAKLVEPSKLSASDPHASARQAFAKETGGTAYESNAEVVANAKVVFLSTKPDQVGAVLTSLKDQLTKEHLVVSICAGVTIATLEKHLNPEAKVVRVMPNTPALVGEGASGFALGHGCSPADGELVSKLLSSCGVAFAVKESLLDAVTGLSGSGPAYAFMTIEALSDGGVACGLPRDVATKLAAQTMLGAAKMVLETGKHPGELKDMVTSPGGTTIEAVHALEKAGIRGAFISAVRAATDKAKTLG